MKILGDEMVRIDGHFDLIDPDSRAWGRELNAIHEMLGPEPHSE